MLTAQREEKAKFMSDTLRKYISREECSQVLALSTSDFSFVFFVTLILFFFWPYQHICEIDLLLKFLR